MEIPTPETLCFSIQGKDNFPRKKLKELNNLNDYLYSNFHGTENYYYDNNTKFNYSDGMTFLLNQIDSNTNIIFALKSLMDKLDLLNSDYANMDMYFEIKINNNLATLVFYDKNGKDKGKINKIPLDADSFYKENISIIYNKYYNVVCLMCEN